MLATRNTVLIIIAVILICLTAIFLYRGCFCRAYTQESFANEDMEMNEEEEELFQDLKANKYSAEEIDDMVAKGVIDQNLVEKFLSKLDTFEAIEDEESEPEPEPEPKQKQKQKQKQKPATKSKSKKN